MSSVYRILLPKRLKDELEKFDHMDWQSETRSFLEERVRRERLKKQIEEARKNKERMKITIDAANLVREEREHAHEFSIRDLPGLIRSTVETFENQSFCIQLLKVNA